MMIFSANTRTSGFTMLEMIISLFILALVLGMGVKVTRNIFADEEMRQANRKLQIFAKTARKQAAAEGRSWELLLKPDVWLLRPLTSDSTEEKPNSGPVADKTVAYRVPETIRWKVRPWGSSSWETPKEISWVFTPGGLCAPFRFRLERGPSWMEMSFNPVSANAQEEEFYLP